MTVQRYGALIWGCGQAEIIQDPAAYAELDPDTAQTLLDQKQAVRALPPSTLPSLHLAYLQLHQGPRPCCH